MSIHINNLPVELLDNIFSLAISEEHCNEYGSLHTTDLVRPFWDLHSLIPTSNSVHASIMGVCPLWKLVLGSGAVHWTTLVITKASLPSIARVARWLLRSKSAPIDIFVKPLPVQNPTPVQFEEWSILFSTLACHLHHVRSLLVVFPDEGYNCTALYDTIFPPRMMVHVPRLESLRIGCWVPISHLPRGFHAPALKCLEGIGPVAGQIYSIMTRKSRASLISFAFEPTPDSKEMLVSDISASGSLRQLSCIDATLTTA